jgi:hypothetical protein
MGLSQALSELPTTKRGSRNEIGSRGLKSQALRPRCGRTPSKGEPVQKGRSNLFLGCLRAYDGGAVSHSSSAIIPRRQATERGCVHRRDGADSAALRPLHAPNAPLKGALRRVAVVRVESRQIRSVAPDRADRHRALRLRTWPGASDRHRCSPQSRPILGGHHCISRRR